VDCQQAVEKRDSQKNNPKKKNANLLVPRWHPVLGEIVCKKKKGEKIKKMSKRGGEAGINNEDIPSNREFERLS